VLQQQNTTLPVSLQCIFDCLQPEIVLKQHLVAAQFSSLEDTAFFALFLRAMDA
jgi:hypothetical protein